MIKRVLAIKKIKKGDQFIIEGSFHATMFARPLRMKDLPKLGNRFPSKAIEDEIFPVGQIFSADREIPKYTVAMIFGEGTV